MAACPVPNPFDDQQLSGLADQTAERIRRAVEIWCRGERLRLDGEQLAAIHVFREAAALGLLSRDESRHSSSTLPHPQVVASGLSGELLLAVRDAIRQATRERGAQDPDEQD
ncbi:MAG: hypothetical protein WD100_13765 [Tistlia sp.]|uniref:hypothetical protein n=1 Tax=Tistlia sp. TaxID=3057121 RepID=UPI0034A23323